MSSRRSAPPAPLQFPVLQVRTPQLVQRHAPPAMWLPAGALAVSMAVAAWGGVVLGALAALPLGVGAGRWMAVVQAHAVLQLWGWFAVSIGVLAFEFVVRLNGRDPLPVTARLVTLGLLTAGAVVFAAGGATGIAAAALTVAGAAMIAAGAAYFLVLVVRVPPARPLAIDLHPLFFQAGAAWLAVSALLLLAGAWRGTAGLIAPPVFDASAEVFLLGFCMDVIVATGLRAFPGHLGLPPVGVRRQRAGWVLLNGTVLLRLAAAAGFGPGSEAAAVAADLGVVLSVAWATVVFAIPGAVRAWGPRSERPQVLVPVAWAGLVAYGLGVAFHTASGLLGSAPVLLATGGVRHLFMAGFVAPLLLAMMHVVLERFGTGRIVWRDGLTAAFALVVVAWPLRALPPIVDPAAGGVTRASMGVAGALLSLGLALAAAVAARNAVEAVRFARQFGRPQ